MGYLDWLKNLSELVLKKAEEYGDVPGTAMPTINLLIDLAKWGQKRGTKPKIIKDLCKKYDLDPKKINNFDDLNTAGIPSDEIELAYSHAIAKTDNPSLVRYLESVRKGLADEIIHNFSQLNMALKSNYQILLPAETILQNPPTQSDFAKPKFFRKTGSVFADFEAGMVYVRENEIKEISDAIEKPHGVLIVGKGANGKSVLVRTLAHQWMKKGKQIKFVELKTEAVDLNKLIEETNRFGKERRDAFLIIEDAHLNPQMVNSYLLRQHQEWPKLLITSRTAEPKLHGESINHFNSLYRIDQKTFDPAEKIIELYFKFKEKEGWMIDTKKVKDLKKYSKKNLWVLSYALDSLNETHGKEIDDYSVLKRVEIDLESLKFTQSNLNNTAKQIFIPILASLSVLYRYEIPTDIKFLTDWLNYPNEFELKTALNELVKMGEAFMKKSNGFFMYGLPHSALAELYYKYGLKSLYSEYVSAEKFVLKYVEALNAINRFELFKPSFHIMGCSVVEKIMPNYSDRIDTQKLAVNITKSTDIYGAGWCISRIFEASAEVGKKLCDATDLQKLAVNIAQHTDIYGVGFCIESIFKASADAGRELWDAIDTQKLAVNIAKSTDIRGVGFCIKSIFKASADAGRELWDATDTQKLATNIAQNTEVHSAGSCISSIFEASAEVGKKLCDAINTQKLAVNIAKSTDIRGVGYCIESIFKASADAGRELWDATDTQKLAANIAKSTYINSVGLCIEGIFKASADAGRELWDAIDTQKLAVNIAKATNIPGVGFCIERIFKSSANAGRELWDAIDTQKLAVNIAKSTDIYYILLCIEHIYKANADAGKEIINDIKKMKINQKLKESIRRIE